MRHALVVAVVVVSGCQCGRGTEVDGGVDSGAEDSGVDAGPADAGDAGSDAGFDGGFDGGFDAGFDAGPPCPGVRVVNFERSCRVRIHDAGLSDAPIINVCSTTTTDLFLEPSPRSQLGATPWHHTDGDLSGNGESGVRSQLSVGTWTLTTALPAGIGRFGFVAHAGRLYVIGGGVPLATSLVWSAAIQGDGSLSAWTAGPPLPVQLLANGAVRWRGHVYVASGWDGMNAHGEVFVAAADSTGMITEWTDGGSFGSGAASGALVAASGSLFHLGGFNLSGPPPGPGREAVIGPTGIPGPWTTILAPAQSRNSFAIAAVDSFIVMIAGVVDPMRVETVEVAHVGSSGQIESWTAGPPLSEAVDSLTATTFDRTVIAIGGFSAVGYRDAVLLADMDNDGGLSGWRTGTAISGPRFDMRATVWDSRIYVAGGYRNGLLSDVQVAPLLGVNSSATVTLDGGTRCVWVCCEGLDGTQCPATDQCP